MKNYLWRPGYRHYDGSATYELLKVVYDELVETDWKCIVQVRTTAQDWAVLAPNGKYLRDDKTGRRKVGQLHQMMRTAIDKMEQELARDA